MEYVEQSRLRKIVLLHLAVNLGLHIIEPTCELVWFSLVPDPLAPSCSVPV